MPADELFDLTGRVAVITGGAGLLGGQHGAALASAGAIPVLADLDGEAAAARAAELADAHGVAASGIEADITREADVSKLLAQVLDEHGRVDILVNNAARNPKPEGGSDTESRLEAFPEERWAADLAVGLTGAFLCSKVIGKELADRGAGVILNVASDLAVIGPDQRLYKQPGQPDSEQPVKPVSYSVIKTGLVGLTRYLATYWADSGVRANAISPGGVHQGQPEEFVQKLSNLIPMARMASEDEYHGAVIFLCSDASAYMTGQNLILDGGRTIW